MGVLKIARTLSIGTSALQRVIAAGQLCKQKRLY
jgi:hypothetical protein